MRQAVVESDAHILVARRTVHRLQNEMLELKRAERFWVEADLRKHKLEFEACTDDDVSAGFRAYAHPVDTARNGKRPVRFDRNLETARMQLLNERLVELKQWLTASADH